MVVFVYQINKEVAASVLPSQEAESLTLWLVIIKSSLNNKSKGVHLITYKFLALTALALRNLQIRERV